MIRSFPVIAVLLLSAKPLAALQVRGPIIGGHWTSADSPVEVMGDVDVQDLVIDPGISVVVKGNFTFKVTGILIHLFMGEPAPPAPFPGCGMDPTPDSLPCDRSPRCP